MGAAGGTGIGLGIMGGILGGIGDIKSAESYKRPAWPGSTPEQEALQDITNQQIQGGAIQYAGGEALLNQMVPSMMSVIPGMNVGASPTSAMGGGAAPTAAGSPMQSYQQALQNYQSAVGNTEQIRNLQGQIQTTPKGPQRQALRQQLKAAQKQQKSTGGAKTMRNVNQAVLSAASTPTPFTATLGSPAGSPAGTPGGNAGEIAGAGASPSADSLGPSQQSTLGSILNWLKTGSNLGPSAGTPSAPATSQPTSTG